jgi:hypothetical protein
VDVNGRTLSIPWLAVLLGLIAPWVARAERVEGDSALAVSRSRLLEPNHPFPGKPWSQASMSPEFAESESEETGEDEESCPAMSFGELLLDFGPSPVRGLEGVPGFPAHRAAQHFFLLGQHLVC